ncbi:Bug family tripartite tricarboxylate transporter substrate binding protein [Pseudorhodoplanes sinuspersici]|uniref:Bug family tripartite tricarboxylate transporter substrate binding protein n=1 Tax=Pseudorhodoplanes sinuspersici TaxID=1235591 RepID=UPI000FEECE12|nr:tripartite tricarboxylate transporter substrate binding protein [Pseudorhodoplanes sinuspersici]RKE67565.1 tripartite-type tricarboxylate transporter receptor subunit TctC [Pseudorhodoplanes sinuspersici]
MTRLSTIGLLVLLSLLLSPLAHADDTYPSRPVRLIATAGPGGNPDVLARLLAQKLSDSLGKPFVVENVPGAGGVVAAKMVAATQPDGHVLMLGDSGGLAINVALNPDVGYSPLKDFTPITALATVPTVLVVTASVPAQTLDEFVKLAKSQPGKLSYGSAGYGSIHHLTMALFEERAGIDLLHVPYRGGTALVNGLLTGEIQAGWSGFPNVIALIETGKLKALCVSILKRSPSLPKVPTCDELGYKGFDIATMIGLQASAGLPAPIVARIQAAAAKALREPDVTERMLALGIDLQENGTAQYRTFMQDDLVRYSEAVKRLKLSPAKAP